jgi:hypothetical protein
MLSSTTMLIEEVDRLVERAVLRISQHRLHVEESRKAGRESGGAQDVLNRMQAALDKLRLYREMLCRDERLPGRAEGRAARSRRSAA